MCQPISNVKVTEDHPKGGLENVGHSFKPPKRKEKKLKLAGFRGSRDPLKTFTAW
jgi:hypothetical protein